MKIKIITFFFLAVSYHIFAQQVFKSSRGLRFFPGHDDIYISLDSNYLRYELFNHWYSMSYYERRQMIIPISDLHTFNQDNDSLQILIRKNSITVKDKRYKLHKTVRQRNICASPENMRKISFAYALVKNEKDLRHFELYQWSDLSLSENDFQAKVLENFAIIQKNRITHH